MLEKMPHTLFRHPFTMVVSGSTGSGKTVWVMRLIANINSVIENGENSEERAIDTLQYCYGALNSNVMELKRRESLTEGKESIKILTHSSVPDEELIRKESGPNRKLLLVLDDLMVTAKSSFLDTLFTLGSHNWGVSVVLVTQHLFGKELRIARNNAHYLVLLRNPAGALQIRMIASHLFPGKHGYFMEAYTDATAQSYSYLLIDMHPKTDAHMRLKACIFPSEGAYSVVYVPKGN